MPSNDYLEIVKKIILENIPKDKFNIFLFGSRATDKYRFAADIDIGVLGNEPIDSKIISDIKDKVNESIVPFDVDIIDFYHSKGRFKEAALKDIKVWNEVKSIKIK